ncbi:uncharacterized protein [Amphiura filiformis]|uniref:uncharacterized protein n=1 Tax=Amphiura filiformis TaxID=82378 RepID=UPI003B20E910
MGQISDRQQTCFTLKKSLEREFPGQQPEDGLFEIDPTGPNGVVPPFLAYCIMSTGDTILNHTTSVFEISGPGPEFEDVILNYNNANLTAMKALTATSRLCRQYIKVESANSRVFDDNKEPLKWWVSANYENMTNWDGPTGTIGCSCGITQSCNNSELLCNSDIVNNGYYSDGGYLADKSTLPILSVHIGDISASGQIVRLTLGSLECIGSSSSAVEAQDIIRPVLTCTADTVVKVGDIDTSTARIWWPFVDFSDDSNYVAKILCDPPLMSDFTTDPTHVICAAKDNRGHAQECGLNVHYAYSYTCHEIKIQHPDAQSGIYQINPRGPDDNEIVPIDVYCDLSSDMGKTILNQTLTEESHILTAVYQNDLAQVLAVIDRSEHCRQLLQMECDGSYVGQRAERFWISRSNNTMYNWGTPTGTRGCPCGLIEAACYNNDTFCNCDIDEVTPGMLNDSGYITDKDTLPVLMIDIRSDLSIDDFILGPVECNGAASEIQGGRVPGPDLTLGWNLDTYRASTGDAGNNVFLVHNKGFPHDGVVTQWRFVATSTNSFKGIIFRHIPGTSGHIWEIVGINDIPGTDVYKVNTYDVPLEERIHVKQGDCFGFHFPTPVVWMDHNNNDITGVRYNAISPLNIRKGSRLHISRGTARAYSLQLTVKSVNKPPVLSCPAEVTETAAIGANSAFVYWSYKEVSDDYESVTHLTCDPAWGSEFHIGQTNVTCTAIDDHDNQVSCTFPVNVLYYPISCYTWKQTLEREFPNQQPEDGVYDIEPLGADGNPLPLFNVFCNMTTGFTIFHHDSEDEHSLVGPVPGNMDITPTYDNTITEMTALIQTSQLCHQYIELKSYNSRVFDEEKQPLKWWVSVDEEQMTNWASPTGIYGCYCGITGNCTYPNASCNSDNYDDEWYTDDGYLTDKSTLPLLLNQCILEILQRQPKKYA